MVSRAVDNGAKRNEVKIMLAEKIIFPLLIKLSKKADNIRPKLITMMLYDDQYIKFM